MTPEKLRRLETALVAYTVVTLAIYLPLETYASIPYGLTNPFYLVDLVAMGLMAWGAWRSWRARPGSSVSVMIAGYAWASANGWRATFDRVDRMQAGGSLDFGDIELVVVGGSTLLAIAVLALLIVIATAARTNA
ncbi:MAG: hypothetical protein AAGL69_03165 [Pseudomonadota bacterium]